MSVLINYSAILLQGTLITLGAWLVAGVASLILGLSLGILSSDLCGGRNLKRLIKIYTFVAKGIPAYVQILIAYYVIPACLGISVSAFMCASFALIFCSTGYITEMIRGAVNAVPRGQWEAAQVLGYSSAQSIRYIVVPQALKIIFPALCGEGEQLLKTTSLLATIGIAELTHTAGNIISRELNPISVYVLVAAIYLLFSAFFLWGAGRLERRFL
jgi:polar amino acid transport system permease protein